MESVLTQFIIETVLPVLGALVLSFGTLIAKRINDKYKLDLSLKTQIVLEQTSIRAVKYAEEYAAKKVKSSIGGSAKISGNEKMEFAINHVLKAVPKVDIGEAKQYIDAAIAGMSGLGSTGMKVIK